MNYHVLFLLGITLTCNSAYSSDRIGKKPVSPPVHHKREHRYKKHNAKKNTVEQQQRELEKMLTYIPSDKRENFLRHVPQHLYQ